MAESSTVAIHQYALASMISPNGRVFYRATTAVGGDFSLRYSTNGSVTWDYLTASGHPRVWAEVDDAGNILSMWEAEDPADRDFPDEPPIEASKGEDGKPISGRLVIPVTVPDEKVIRAVMDRLPSAPRGQWLTQSRLASLGAPDRVQRELFCDQCRERGLEAPDDPRDALAISDYDRRYWYIQLWLRQASRLLHDHRASTLIELYKDMFRVDRKTGKLLLP